MKFEELSINSQSFLIDQLSIHIENATKLKDIIEPTYDEYRNFFNDYDEDYEIVDKYPQSVIESEFHNTYRIEFQGEKVILVVYPPH